MLTIAAPAFLSERDRARFERRATRAYRRAQRERVEADVCAAFGRFADAVGLELCPDVVALVYEDEVADRCRRE